MRKFGLIGYPLGHSFSKMYFENKFLTESISECSYENYEIESLESLKSLITKESELKGLNVTIPHKSEILKYLDYIDDEASEIGAVNVLKISDKSGGRFIKGFNTDIFGFKESLTPHLKGKIIYNALILGTGGSSKAVAYVLGKLGIKILYIARKSSEDSISYSDMTDDILIDNKLVINTTPLGMFPNTADSPCLNYDCLTPEHILFDLVYNPPVTVFLRKGEERGCTVIGGLKMLQLQAEKSWEIWNNNSV
jgi:shikimate dehydrogenase